MQRKLISFEAFNQIEQSSLNNAHKELSGITDHLSQALGVAINELRCYNGNSVVYETNENTFVSATYKIDENRISLSNIEEIVINEESEEKNRKQIIGEMIEAFHKDDEHLAEQAWGKLSNFIEGLMKKGRMAKSACSTADDNFKKMGKKMNEARLFVRRTPPNVKKVAAAKRTAQQRGAKLRAHSAERSAHRKLNKAMGKGRAESRMAKLINQRKGGFARIYNRDKKLKEWSNVAVNVDNYIDLLHGNSMINETHVEYNDHGDVSALSIPVSRVRNEGKVINYKMNTLKTDVKILREEAHNLVKNIEFCKMVAELKRFNNVSNSDALEECLNRLVVKYPSVLYLTQGELAQTLGESLKTVGAVNFDDTTCVFMAEGILRTAHQLFPERVDRILRLTNNDVTNENDAYLDFQNRVESLFLKVDESTASETQMASDIYNALMEMSDSVEDDLKSDIIYFLDQIEPMVEGKVAVDLDMLGEASDWILTLIETNLETEPWKVSDTDVEETINGDSPKLAMNYKKSYSPDADFSGTPKRPLQIGSDTMNFGDEEGEKHGWGNVDGGETWDKLSNPYLPKSIVPYIKGEKSIEDDDSFGTFQSGDTWPNLDNPYNPSSVVPKRPE